MKKFDEINLESHHDIRSMHHISLPCKKHKSNGFQRNFIFGIRKEEEKREEKNHV